MDSNISFLLFGFWGLISNFQLEITFICSLSLFTFPKECNLHPCICYFLSLLVCSYFKIKLAHFKYWNYVWFLCSGLWTILQTHCFVWYFLSHYHIFFVLQAPASPLQYFSIFVLNIDCQIDKCVTSTQIMQVNLPFYLHTHNKTVPKHAVWIFPDTDVIHPYHTKDVVIIQFSQAQINTKSHLHRLQLRVFNSI